nr:M23 family metallopeptidase [Rhabdobacter roseus]
MSMGRLLGIGMIMGLLGWSRVVTPAEQLLDYCRQFRAIHEAIGAQAISPDSAERAFQEVMVGLRQSFGSRSDSCRVGSEGYFVFPLRGQVPRYSIGGRGRGYKPNGFDLFDNEVRGSHPAHDLFIRDRNQDNIDDVMCQPVDVLAFTSGIVLAVENNWHPESERRGGNYVWIYDPCLDGLFYYAHNKCVAVEPGQWVWAGDKIAEVGRTGLNAFQERSPTHLHFMFLRLTPNALPEPGNTYDWLLSASVKEWEWWGIQEEGEGEEESP